MSFSITLNILEANPEIASCLEMHQISTGNMIPCWFLGCKGKDRLKARKKPV